MLLRSGLPVPEDTLVVYAPTVARAILPSSTSIQSVAMSARPSLDAMSPSSEPASYVVPPRSTGHTPALSASLADYALAHSAVLSPLARGSLLSTLIGNESVAPVDVVAPAVQPDVQPDAHP